VRFLFLDLLGLLNFRHLLHHVVERIYFFDWCLLLLFKNILVLNRLRPRSFRSKVRGFCFYHLFLLGRLYVFNKLLCCTWALLLDFRDGFNFCLCLFLQYLSNYSNGSFLSERLLLTELILSWTSSGRVFIDFSYADLVLFA